MSGKREKISIIMPALDEAACIRESLMALLPLRGKGHEVIVADGGSRDGTHSLANRWADKLLVCERGRAWQMNAGARQASHGILLFLHADTLLPPDADSLVLRALAGGAPWGRFDIRLSGRRASLRLIERAVNWRSAATGVATGDQAIFVRREAFEAAGGFDSIPLMEDVALSKKLRRQGWPRRIRQPVLTSSRRWEQAGILSTVLLMWRLRAAYFLGADPRTLAAAYRKSPGRP